MLDPQEQTLRYANAGHNPPIVRRALGNSELLTRTGAAIGSFDELQICEETIKIGDGDAIVMYTDGVTVARNRSRELYGDDRLITAIAAAPRKAGELLAQLEADLDAFTRETPQSDDIAFLVITSN